MDDKRITFDLWDTGPVRTEPVEATLHLSRTGYAEAWSPKSTNRLRREESRSLSRPE